MKKLTVMLLAVVSLLSGCIAYDFPYHDGEHRRDGDSEHRSDRSGDDHRDRDRDRGDRDR